MRSESSEYHQSKSDIETEMEWIGQAQKKPEHFAPLYDKYYVKIFHYLDNRTSDRDLAAELTSQVFVKALKAIKKFVPQGVPFGSWLYRIAYNVIQQHFRDASKERSVSLNDEQLNFLADDPDSEAQLKEEKLKIVQQLLDQLKEHELQLIEMRFFEGRSFKEIGEVLELTENNAKVKTHRVVEKLRKKLKQ